MMLKDNRVLFQFSEAVGCGKPNETLTSLLCEDNVAESSWAISWPGLVLILISIKVLSTFTTIGVNVQTTVAVAAIVNILGGVLNPFEYFT